MFETRSEAWAAVGLKVEVNEKAVRRARNELLVLVPMLIAAVVGKDLAVHHIHVLAHPGAHKHASKWFGFLTETPVEIIAALLVLVIGWLISRDASRIAPALFRRMDPGTAGTVEFLIRFLAVAVTILGAMGIAGISLQALAVGGAFTAVVIGLAAQQTLGNLIAGMVLLSARPFRLGERIRLQAGAVGGRVEGIVSSLGLLYTTLAQGEDRMLIPNNVVLAAAVVPLREPESVDVKVRLSSGVRPSHVQAILDANVSVATRNTDVVLDEIDGDSVVVRVKATPERRADGAKLADQIIAALADVSGEHELEDQHHS
jgi:small-conductance mechanosensitive channel